ncbi:MAG TPA: amidohydrolase family protein [Clostridiales bacterium]|nr:amidohydrolase family protein [Clostridiales bacterium]
MLKKIDIHAHSIRIKGINFYKSKITLATPDEVAEVYARIGVEKGILLPLINTECGGRMQGNEDAIEIVEQYPDLFYWFCNIDPRMGLNSTKTDLSFYLEYYKERGAKGVGEIGVNMYFDDPFMENLFYHCQKNQMPILFHSSTCIGGIYGLADEVGLPRLEKELGKFPDLAFIGHAPPFWSHISNDLTAENWGNWYYPNTKVIPDGRLAKLMRKYPNLYGDISAGSGSNAMLRDPEFSYDFIEEFQDQLLYGTDISSNKFNLKISEWLDEAVQNGKISYKAYEKVSRLNALKLLKEI